MEAVGLAASLITLIGATSLTSSMLTRLWGLRGIPLHVLAALNEVNDFQATLALVQSALMELGDGEAAVENLLIRARERLDAFNNYLHEKVFREGDGSNTSTQLRKRAKLKEVVGQAQCEINALQQELMSVKISLGLALNVTNLRSIPKLLTTIQRISVVQAGDIATMVPDTISDPVTTLEQATSAGFQPALNELTRSPSSSSPSGYMIDPSCTYVKIETKTISRTCKRRCPCHCHIPLQGTTPRWLRGFLGAAFFSFTCTPLLNRRPCNFRHCGQKVHGMGAVRFQYFFPSWLLPLGIEFTASWRSLNGIGGTWSLKIPRLITDSFVYNKLYHAARYGSVSEFCQVMELHGVKSSDKLSMFEDFSLAMLASHLDRGDICTMLLECGADVSAQNSNGVTFGEIVWAEYLIWGNLQAVQTRPELKDGYEDLKLPVATEMILQDSIESLKRHLELHPEAVLLQDSYSYSSLHWAGQCANLEAMDLLIEAGANVHAECKRGRSVLTWTLMRSSSVASWVKLIDAGADVNSVDHDGYTALLMILTSGGVSKEVNFLLEAGAHVNHQNKFGRTALMQAALIQTESVCETLLRFGADIEAQDNGMRTAIFYAVEKNNYPVIELLLRYEASINRLTRWGHSLVHHAAWWGDIETMRILQEARIEGLPMDSEAVEEYWSCFNYRDDSFWGQRLPLEVEEAAFQALLDSIIPSDLEPASDENMRVPGAFPPESDDNTDEDSEEGDRAEEDAGDELDGSDGGHRPDTDEIDHGSELEDVSTS